MSCCPACGQKISRKPFSVDYSTGRVEVDGRAVILPCRLTQLLGALVDAYPCGLTKERLHFAVYGDRIDGGPAPKGLDVLLFKVRAALRLAEFKWIIIRQNKGGIRLVRLGEAEPQIVEDLLGNGVHFKTPPAEQNQRFTQAMRRETEAA